MMTPEARVKKAVKQLLEAEGVYFFFPPANGFGRAGIPDVICCIRGRFLAVECKAGRGRTTALQDREMERIIAAGGGALVVYEDLSLLKTTINELKELP